MKFEHTSVLLKEVLDNLAIKPDGIYVDGTLGGGGHSYHILERLTSGGRLIGIDQDTDAIRAAGERLSCFEDQVTIVHDNYEHIAEVLEDLSISAASFWIWGWPPISWIIPREASRTERTRRWI